MALRLTNPIGKTLKNAVRLRTIVGVFAKHGLQNVVERTKLDSLLNRSVSENPGVENLSIPERLRLAFEELGPTYVKLGQLLATRPDLIPEDYVAEFSKLHDQVKPLAFSDIESVLKTELKDYYSDFVKIESQPLGSASIAQVHRAQLKSGEQVVIKVQRPGLLETIDNDLNVLYFIADVLEKYVPESKIYSPQAIVEEYFKALELETNFVVEANNLRRLKNNFADSTDVKIPEVYWNYCTEKVLVMEALEGTPLSQWSGANASEETKNELFQKVLKAYMKMVFADGLFHGDLHAGNVFFTNENQIGLIDLGVVGRLTRRTQAAIVNMLLALSKEDYERLALEYVELAPFTDQVNIEVFAKDLRELIAPFYGLTLRDINLGKLLLSSASLASVHQLRLPAELLLFFKSLVGIESIGRKIQKNFDFLQSAMAFADDLSKSNLIKEQMEHQVSKIARDSQSLFNNLPRQINFLFKKLNSPDHAFNLKVDNLNELKKSLSASFNLVFLGLIITALVISGSLVYPHSVGRIGGLPTLSFIMYVSAGILGVFAFINYLRKS